MNICSSILNKDSNISSLFSLLSKNERVSYQKISLVASENILSPLAKLPFLFNFHGRYFLDDLNRFGNWLFPSGAQVVEIEQNLLIPLLSEMAKAAYVNVRPISGMNCMMVALAGLTNPNDLVFTIPYENGGHFSTPTIVKELARNIQYIPFRNAFDIDFECLEKMLVKKRPALIYIDQSTLLFPIDPKPIRELIDSFSPETILHYDSSHTNGLIIGNAMFNPLERGAHSYGGSTHKTFPGPHKGFLATNNIDIANKIQNISNHFVSHHHTSSTISFVITLMEMKWCNGSHYAKQVILNSKIFAKSLSQHGFYVSAEERDFTGCHQVWGYPYLCNNIRQFADVLSQVGIMTNLFNSLPGIDHSSFRLSLSEATRMGATPEDAELLAIIMSEILESNLNLKKVKDHIKYLSEKLSQPKFCFQINDINTTNIPENIIYFLNNFFGECSRG